MKNNTPITPPLGNQTETGTIQRARETAEGSLDRGEKIEQRHRRYEL